MVQMESCYEQTLKVEVDHWLPLPNRTIRLLPPVIIIHSSSFKLNFYIAKLILPLSLNYNEAVQTGLNLPIITRSLRKTKLIKLNCTAGFKGWITWIVYELLTLFNCIHLFYATVEGARVGGKVGNGLSMQNALLLGAK